VQLLQEYAQLVQFETAQSKYWPDPHGALQIFFSSEYFLEHDLQAGKMFCLAGSGSQDVHPVGHKVHICDVELSQVPAGQLVHFYLVQSY
jgi:hypothetical protein